jgi:hypothetical protein
MAGAENDGRDKMGFGLHADASGAAIARASKCAAVPTARPLPVVEPVTTRCEFAELCSSAVIETMLR